MKKYLLALLTFIVSFFVLEVFNTFLITAHSHLILGQGLVAIIVFALTRYVYKKYNTRTVGAIPELELTQLSDSDREGFEKSFTQNDFEQYGIEKLIVANGKEEVCDYVVGVKTFGEQKLDVEWMKSKLYKKFYKHLVFVFINLDQLEEESKVFEGGSEIRKDQLKKE